MSGLEKAAAAKVLGANFTLYRAIQQIYPTHRYAKTRRFEVVIPADCYKIKVTGCGPGGGTHGGFIGGGGSGGGVAGRWVEDFEIKVVPGETLYCQVGGGGIPTAAGSPPAQIATADITYIRRGSHSGVILLFLRGQVNWSMAVPTVDRGGQAQLAEATTVYNPNIAQPAAGAVGSNGISMAQFPTPNTGDMFMTYPPLTTTKRDGNYGTNPGSGGGVSGGTTGQNGGRMGRFISQARAHAGGTASGAVAGGGAPAIGLPLEKWEAQIRKDANIEAFVEPTSGVNVVVDTPVQKMWGAGGVGAAGSRMGGYGGDGVLIIEYITGLETSALHKKILMPCDLIDSVANSSGLAVPSTFLGRHGFVSADAITNGYFLQQVKLSNNAGFLRLTIGTGGDTFYNNSLGDNIRIDAIGAAGANLTGKITALSKENIIDPYNRVADTNIPIASVAVTVGTATNYQFRTMGYSAPWAWGVFRTHGADIHWSSMHTARLQMTTVSGSNALTFVSSINNSINDLIAERAAYLSGANYQGVVLTPLHELSGTGIPVGTRIASMTGNNITMTANATASANVTVQVYDITKFELYLASPMSTGKRMMFTLSGTPVWLAASNIVATNRNITSNVVTIGHAALPAALQVGVKILVRNCGNAAVNGSDKNQTALWTVISGGSTTTTRFNVPPTANEGTTADTNTEILIYSNMDGYGYMNPPNAALGDGFGEVSTFTTWLMTKYGSIIDFIDTQNEANSGRSHNTGALDLFQVQQGIWWTGTFDELGDLVRRINIAAKAVKPAVKIGLPSLTGLALGQAHYKTTTSRSNLHMLCSAADGVGGKLVNWVDYMAIHIYDTVISPDSTGRQKIIDQLRYYRELFMMESINKPDMDILMTEGGNEVGVSQDFFKAQPVEWQTNFIKKWHILQAGFGLKGVYPFVDGFMGEPARYPEHEAAYVWIATNLQGKTIHTDSCFNEDTGEVYFKNTTGFEEYIP